MTGLTLPMSWRIASSLVRARIYVVPVSSKRVRYSRPAIDRMPNQDFGVLLTVTIDAAVTLLHDVRIVRDLVWAVAIILQVDAFGGRIGRERIRIAASVGFVWKAALTISRSS